MSSSLLLPSLLILLFLYTPVISIKCHMGLKYESRSDSWKEENEEQFEKISASIEEKKGICEGSSCFLSRYQDQWGISRFARSFCAPEKCDTTEENKEKCEDKIENGQLTDRTCCCNSGDFCMDKERVNKFLEEYGTLPAKGDGSISGPIPTVDTSIDGTEVDPSASLTSDVHENVTKNTDDENGGETNENLTKMNPGKGGGNAISQRELDDEFVAPTENVNATHDEDEIEPEYDEETRKPVVIPDYPDEEQEVTKGKRRLSHFYAIIVAIFVM